MWRETMIHNDFHTTHWSVVLTAKGDNTAAKAALVVLCETYYSPIHKYLLRSVTTDHNRYYGGRDSTDLTHDFFAYILEGKMFAQLQRDGAPFRVYLLGALRHFLSYLRHREAAQKRGGNDHCVSFSEESPRNNARNHAEPPDSHDFDDTVFDREWALAMIQRAMHSLEPTDREQLCYDQQHREETRDIPVKRLLPWITQEMTAESRRCLAVELGISDAAVKVALHRLRKKFRHNIRSLIAETVKDASEIDGELRHLIKSLKSETAPGNETMMQ